MICVDIYQCVGIEYSKQSLKLLTDPGHSVLHSPFAGDILCKYHKGIVGYISGQAYIVVEKSVHKDKGLYRVIIYLDALMITRTFT